MPMIKHCNTASLLPTIIALTATTWAAIPLHAQGNNPTEGTPVAATAATALETEPALATKVSLEAKRQPLTELIGALQKQSGVTLSVAPGTPAALVTARIKEMPLFEVMNNLSRVYGVKWNREGGGYRMSAKTLSALERKVLQTGDPHQYRYNSTLLYSNEMQKQADADLAAEVYDAVDEAVLRTPEGVAFSSLPPELQLRIRARLEETSGDKLFRNSLPVWDTLNQDLSLQLQSIPSDAPSKPVAEERFGSISTYIAGLKVVNSDGRLVARIFPELAPPPVKKRPSMEEVMERFRKQKARAVGDTDAK